MKLIKFSAVWCGPCKQQHSELEHNPLPIPVEEYDIEDDACVDLVEKFQIRSIPTMVLLDDEDNELTRWCGYTRSAKIIEEIEKVK